MDLKERLIIEDYRKKRDDFILLGDIVRKMLEDITNESGVKILAIEHRVKAERSLAGKIAKSDGWYNSFEELTDILGARVICFFADEVDVIGKQIEKHFKIDWENSSDKRKLLDANAFGYLSLHYICSLPEGEGYPDKLLKLRFEIQIRTILQHSWSDIEHDLRYKSEFGLPRRIIRDFSRMASLLELADDEFVRIRDNVKAYTEDIRQHIIDDTADEIPINMVSLDEFVKRNAAMRSFLERLTGICNAEIEETVPDSYIKQLAWLNITTIGELSGMLHRNEESAFRLAEKSLKNSELDILSSSVGLRFLCRAELIRAGYTVEQATEFMKLSVSDEKRALRQAKMLFETVS